MSLKAKNLTAIKYIIIIKTRKYKRSQLTQRGMCDNGACLKAMCEYNLSSPVPSVDMKYL